MFYLLLAILSSTGVSVFMRLCDKQIKNNMVMFMSNYGICILLSAFYMRDHIFFDPATVSDGDLRFAVLLGLISGAMYLLSFILLHVNIRKNGVVLAGVFMKLGVLVPTFMAVFVYHEETKPLQMVGFVLAVIAIVVINIEKNEKSDTQGKTSFVHARIWLLVMLVASGFTDSLANIYDKQGDSYFKDHYLVFTFFAACIFSILMAIREKQKIALPDLLSGFLIGIPNYFSARFLLLSLGSVKAVVVYPVYNVATILFITTFGLFLFREYIGKRKGFGLGLILLALVFLNL